MSVLFHRIFTQDMIFGRAEEYFNRCQSTMPDDPFPGHEPK